MKYIPTVKLAVPNSLDAGQEVLVRTRSYTVVNSDELKRALTCMRQDIETILDMTLDQSGLVNTSNYLC